MSLPSDTKEVYPMKTWTTEEKNLIVEVLKGAETAFSNTNQFSLLAKVPGVKAILTRHWSGYYQDKPALTKCKNCSYGPEYHDARGFCGLQDARCLCACGCSVMATQGATLCAACAGIGGVGCAAGVEGGS